MRAAEAGKPSQRCMGTVAVTFLLLLSVTLGSNATRAHADWLQAVPKDACLQPAALRPRVRKYLRGSPPQDMVIEFDHSPPLTFLVRRGDRMLSERPFPQLPMGCKARLDAIAHAMAESIEELERVQLSSAARSESTPITLHVGVTASTVSASNQSAPRLDDDEIQARRADPHATRRTSARQVTSKATTTPQPHGYWGLSAGAGMFLDVQPDAAPEFHIGADLLLDPIAISAMVHWSPTLGHDWDAIADGSVAASAVGTRVGVCLGEGARILRAEACIGVFGAMVFTQGRGFDVDRSESAGLVAGTLGLRVRFPATTPFGVRIRVDAQTNFLRPELRVTASESSAFTFGILGAGAFLEFDWRAP